MYENIMQVEELQRMLFVKGLRDGEKTVQCICRGLRARGLRATGNAMHSRMNARQRGMRFVKGLRDKEKTAQCIFRGLRATENAVHS